MAKPVTVAVDALGGDNAPGVVLEGCEAALAADKDLSIILCGPADVVEPFARAHERCTPVVTTEFISQEEHPAQAVRKKKDSSLVVAARQVKEGAAQGFFSAGSTGAVLSAATLVIGRIKGVKRPCLTTVLPSPVKPVVLTDVGANADCKPEYLVQFARMGTIYMENVIGVKNPRVALLNIGSEEAKGSEFAQKCHALMKEQVPGFAGNGEGTDILPGNFDLFVSDGFTGNVCLKTIEGTAGTLLKAIKGMLGQSLKTKIGALCIKDELYKLKDSVSADTYGGAPLLGVKGACVKGHGSSNRHAIENGVAFTATIVRTGVCQRIAESMAQLAGQEAEKGEVR